MRQRMQWKIFVLALSTFVLCTFTTTAQDDGLPNVKNLGGKTLQHAALSARMNQLMRDDDEIKNLGNEMKSKGFMASSDAKSFFGYEETFHRSDGKTAKLEILMQDYNKKGAQDLGAVGMVKLTAGDRTEVYSFAPEAPGGKFDEALEHRTDRKGAVREIENHIFDQTEAVLNDAVAHISRERFDSLRLFGQQRTMIERVFLIDRSGRLLFPRMFKTGSAYRFNDVSKEDHPFVQAIACGEKFELERQYTPAIAEYYNGFKHAKNPEDKSTLQLRIARCYFKEERYPEAERTYRMILDDPSVHFSSDALPPVIISYT